MKKKRVRLTIEEKPRVDNHHEQNPKISQAKIGLGFSVRSRARNKKKTRNKNSITKVGVLKIEMYELESF